MHFTFGFLVSASVLSGVSPAWGQKPMPAFKNYLVTERYNGSRATPKIKRNTDAWSYRTHIRWIAQQKPNFAGHYSIGFWGCGNQCLNFAIVDIKTGSVYFNQSQECSWDMKNQKDITKLIKFHLNSKLLYLNCAIGEEEAVEHYYSFENNRLIALR